MQITHVSYQTTLLSCILNSTHLPHLESVRAASETNFEYTHASTIIWTARIAVAPIITTLSYTRRAFTIRLTVCSVRDHALHDAAPAVLAVIGPTRLVAALGVATIIDDPTVGLARL